MFQTLPLQLHLVGNFILQLLCMNEYHHLMYHEQEQETLGSSMYGDK